MPSAQERLERLLAERILVLDGAMGTMFQAYRSTRPTSAASAFARSPARPEGRQRRSGRSRAPDVVEEIHRAYLDAGADIIETNTFNAHGVSQADYGLEAGSPTRSTWRPRGSPPRPRGTDGERDPGRPRFVAGSLGPTNRTLSLSPDVENPAFRAITFDELRDAYDEQVRGLVDGGVDLLLAETIFDTLNLKAALFAIEESSRSRRCGSRSSLSVTITDQSGRTLSGQTIEAFWISIAHAAAARSGSTARSGAHEMRPYLEELAAHRARATSSCYPNAGLPNAFGGYDETPEQTARAAARVRARRLAEHRRRLLRHHAGAHRGDRRGGRGACAPRPPAARRASRSSRASSR